MSKARMAFLGFVGVIPVVLALSIAGFDVSYQLGNYVVSDNATVTGDLVQASAPTAGQVTDLLVEVGEPVQRNQALVSLAAGLSPTGQVAVGARLPARVRAPGEGTVISLSVTRGQNVSAGQTVAILSDLDRLWVIANVDETSFKSVRPGQRAEVYLPALDRNLEGKVAAILPAASRLATSGTLQAQQSAGSATRTAPQIPVRVDFDYDQVPVLPGMTATVRIYIRS